MLKNKSQKNLGFTLIELLVVISIIGLLSTLAVVSLNNARIKARDTRRLADVRQLVTAFKLYADDNGGRLPNLISGTQVCLGHGDDGEGCYGFNDNAPGSTDFDNLLSPKYIGNIPLDPLGTGNSAGYVYTYPFSNLGFTGGTILWPVESCSPTADLCGMGLLDPGLGAGNLGCNHYCILQFSY